MIEILLTLAAGALAGYCVRWMQAVEREREQLVTRINLRKIYSNQIK